MDRSRKLLRRLAVLAAILCVVTGVFVAYGKHCIQRGASWRGFAWDDRHGLVLVFNCEPESGIRRAYFHLAPLGTTTFDKVDCGL